jgi:hypothetical protein
MRFIKTDEVPLEALLPWDKAKNLFPRYSQQQIGDLNDYHDRHGEDSILPLIVSVDCRIVDGYNRFQAAQERGQRMLQVQVYAYNDDAEMEIHAIVLNAKRRHLDSVYAARAAARLEELYKPKAEDTKAKQSKATKAQPRQGNRLSGSTCPHVRPERKESSLDKAAKEVGVDPATVRAVKKIDATQDAELITAVENKDIPINVGAKLASVTNEDIRREALRSELDKRNVALAKTIASLRQVGAEHYIAGCIDAQLKLEEGRKKTPLEQLSDEQLRHCIETLASVATKLAMMKQELDKAIKHKQQKEIAG